MNIVNKYESPLVLKGIEITEASFKKQTTDVNDLELRLDVGREVKSIEHNTYEVIWETTISEKDDMLSVYVKTRGVFYTEQENLDMIDRNTIAIMFPYVRSYISLLSTQPGMQPIVLPAMNILAMMQDKANR